MLVHEPLNIDKRFCCYRTSEMTALVPKRTQEYLAGDKLALIGARDGKFFITYLLVSIKNVQEFYFLLVYFFMPLASSINIRSSKIF